VQRILLSDDELWRAIAENTEAMSALIHKQVELETGIGAQQDPRSRTTLTRSNAQKIDKFESQYHGFAAELRRRYPE